MRKLSRPFAGLVTGLRNDAYSLARIKLTLFYIVLITIVVVVLSSSVYSFQTSRFLRYAEERREELQGEGASESEFDSTITDYLLELRVTIIAGGAITVAIAGILSYFLAGRTLRPIRLSHESQRRFIANAAHDLRTPLSVMKTEAEVALKGGELGSPEAERLIRSQLEEIDRMARMVEQMLQLMRSGGDSPGAPERTFVDIGGLLETAVGKLRVSAAEKSVTIDMNVRPPCRVSGDEEALARAFLNVLHNAVTYTPPGGALSVLAEPEDAHIKVVIADTGMGIAAQDLPKVTEPFYRGDAARGVRDGGAGLGLSIVEETVTDHGGSLKVESEPGTGTTVTIRLPSS